MVSICILFALLVSAASGAELCLQCSWCQLALAIGRVSTTQHRSVFHHASILPHHQRIFTTIFVLSKGFAAAELPLSSPTGDACSEVVLICRALCLDSVNVSQNR